MITRMPARWQVSTASGTSRRGGSIMPARPRKTMSFSAMSSSSSPSSSGRSRVASASTRRPLRAMASTASRIKVRISWSISRSSTGVHCTRVQRPISSSAEPLQKAIRRRWPPGSVISWIVDILRLFEEKGISLMRTWVAASRLRSSPPLSAATLSAPSVGSPSMRYLPVESGGCSFALLQSPNPSRVWRRTPVAAWISAPVSSQLNVPVGSNPTPPTEMMRPLTQSFLTVSSFWVNVPVLSEQMTVQEPRVSTLESFLTTTLRLDMRCVPTARQRVTSGSMPSGTKATTMPSAKMKASIIVTFATR
eukprot:comp21874_c0_seq1/m.49553 comp21874_c0_seq1/g.49553  ORF comp21874_c0_seq1/g.49553 comp21874_c0_seq1/m.49553 type:complete len:307 (-) comp21874_c0_seq1:449-1369(-)